jgi:hypothetical protein
VKNARRSGSGSASQINRFMAHPLKTSECQHLVETL